MTIYIRDPTVSIRNQSLFKKKKGFSKVAGYKINTKYTAFSYMKAKNIGKGIWEIILFTEPRKY